MPNNFFCSSHIKGIACLTYPAVVLATADEAGDIFTKHSKHQEAKYLSRSEIRRTSQDHISGTLLTNLPEKHTLFYHFCVCKTSTSALY